MLRRSGAAESEREGQRRRGEGSEEGEGRTADTSPLEREAEEVCERERESESERIESAKGPSQDEEGERERRRTGLHVLVAPEARRVVLAVVGDLLGEVVVRVAAVEVAGKERHDVEQFRVVDLERDVAAARKSESVSTRSEEEARKMRGRGGTHCTQGWIQPAYLREGDDKSQLVRCATSTSGRETGRTIPGRWCS